ncbi:serine-threonine kinase receptor-associated protein [Tremella mesenterica]|uniref:Serine-threonine kinase receptor-associated protein n=1 Tax=Tremella mesenterica TaxID=5217 RepID=A0A4V1M391_TREME|nr:serine-threonine kinase receptor-associated protein [Tremella mesenterica]
MNGQYRNPYSHTPTPEPMGNANGQGYMNPGPGLSGMTGLPNGNGNNGGNVPGVKVQPLLCSGHTRPVVHLQFSNLLDDGTYLLISSCKDGNPMLRSWLGDWIGTFIGHKGAVWSSKISLDTTRAVTGSADFSAKIWDCATGEALHSFPHNHIVRTVALNPQQTSQYLLTGGHEKKIRLYDLGRPDADPLILGKNSEGLSCDGVIRSIVWDEFHGGTVGVSAGEDGLVRWWDLRSLSQTASLDLGDPVTSMELAHGGGTLSVTAGKKVHFLDIQRQHPPVTIPLSQPPTSASLHPFDRDRFVAGSTADPWVRVYDLDTGAEKEVYKGHHGPVLCASYSPDGEVYASGSEDGTIRLWQTNPGKSYGLWQTAE